MFAIAKITLSGFRILRKTIFSVNGRNLSDQKLSGNFYGVSKRGSRMRSLPSGDTPRKINIYPNAALATNFLFLPRLGPICKSFTPSRWIAVLSNGGKRERGVGPTENSILKGEWPIFIITSMSWMDRIIWTLKTIIITGISCIMWTHLRTHRHAQTNTDLQDRSRAQRFILPRCNAICAPRLRLLKHASMAALSCRTRRPNCKGE